MPSEGRSSRGKTRARTRALKGTRGKVTKSDAESQTVSPPLSVSQPNMAAAPQAAPQASPRGLRRERRGTLMKTLAQNHLVVFLLATGVLTLLCYHFGYAFWKSVSEIDYFPNNNDNPDGQSLEDSARRVLISFFFPTTCTVKENQEVKACNNMQNLNKNVCLEYKCCYSSFGTKNFRCYAPLINKPLQIFRMFGCGVFSMIILGCLPMYCFSLPWRSKWAAPLRRKVNRLFKRLKKQRDKLKRDAEMLRAAMENEEELSDEKEEEKEALFFN